MNNDNITTAADLEVHQDQGTELSFTELCARLTVEIAQREDHGLDTGELWRALDRLTDGLSQLHVSNEDIAALREVPSNVTHFSCEECILDHVLDVTITDEMVDAAELLTEAGMREEALMDLPKATLADAPLRFGSGRARTLSDWNNDGNIW